MRSRLLIPFVILLLASCGPKNRIPSDILSQKKMQAVLWDVMRADQFLADYVLNKDSTADKVNESFKLYDKIFTMHQVSKEQFQKSFSFYKEHPALLKVIMDSIGHTPIEAPTQTVVPAQVAAPTPVVQQQPVPDTLRRLLKPLQDTMRVLRKNKGIRLQ